MVPNSKIASFKQPDFRLQILDDRQEIIGALVPIVGIEGFGNGLLDKMVDWRNRFRTSFKTQFTATKGDTRDWLLGDVVAPLDKVLFLVEVEDIFVGHIGLADVTAESAELDNVLRGERVGDPRLFVFALYALLEFAFDQLVLRRVVSKVFSNNVRAVRLYKGMGMTEISARPLFKRDDGARVAYEECDEAQSNVAFKYTTLSISSDRFAAVKLDELRGAFPDQKMRP